MSSQEPDVVRRNQEFVRLFQQHQRQIYGYILSLVPNIAAADEISQDTNLRIWEQFDRFDPSTDFVAWACSVAYYQVLTYRKTIKRQHVRFDSQLLDILANDAISQHDDLAARQSHLIDCLTHLSEFKRQVVRFYYCFGMTAKSVAEKLDRNVTAVEKTLVRTRHTLHDCIEAAMRREDRL
jgi:RNA polymerase sigma-70 factor, ECF subfamily